MTVYCLTPGNKKKIVVSTIVENGKDIKLTIDSDLQKELYEQFKDDKSFPYSDI